MLDETETKMCGSIDTSDEKRKFWVECNAPASTLVIQLDNVWLNVAEVRIYGLGKSMLMLIFRTKHKISYY